MVEDQHHRHYMEVPEGVGVGADGGGVEGAGGVEIEVEGAEEDGPSDPLA